MVNEMQSEIIRSVHDLPQDWDNYVDRHRHGSLFHSRLWFTLLTQVYKYECQAIVIRDNTASIAGILPAMIVRSSLTGNRIISLPFSYICGPLADTDAHELRLLEAAREVAKELSLGYLELKADHSLSLPDEPFVCRDDFKTYRLSLDRTEEELWNGLHKSMIQRGINKATREGITVAPDDSADAGRRFDYLNRITCRKHGIPAQPREFFDRVWEQLVSAGKADCLFASHQGREIAAVIIFYDKKRAIYMYGGSLPETLALRPNHILLWSAILRAKEKGCTEFDFGRVSADNNSLADFKKRWGALEVPLHYYFWPEKRGVGSSDRRSFKIRMATSLFSRSPLFLTRRLSWLYRHLA